MVCQETGWIKNLSFPSIHGPTTRQWKKIQQLWWNLTFTSKSSSQSFASPTWLWTVMQLFRTEFYFSSSTITNSEYIWTSHPSSYNTQRHWSSVNWLREGIHREKSDLRFRFTLVSYISTRSWTLNLLSVEVHRKIGERILSWQKEEMKQGIEG